jgi:MoaA/NifB/PqqE/SkfB family radical SAM enzyme/SAM-dependent methyltransferase
MRGPEFLKLVATRPPASRMDPALAAFFREYLEGEKAVAFGGRLVLNSHFPPWPSAAFDAFLRQYAGIGESGGARRLFSVTLAVTNRCRYRCWHCYNAGRSFTDTPLGELKRLARDLQEHGAVMVTLTGGEPLLRHDLEEVVRAFDERACLVLNTTGDGLSPSRAGALKDAGLFALGVSLDSVDEAEHDRLRGVPGAFRTALAAISLARDAGLYPYVITVARHELLERGGIMAFLSFAQAAGAREVHLLEPAPIGRLAGHAEVRLSPAEREQIIALQREVAAREDLPVLSCFAYFESARFFGCGAGLTHLYIDGSGELCPCNLVPLSFGNVTEEPLDAILARMARHFDRPRPSCVGCDLAGKYPGGRVPAPPALSELLCAEHLPREHALPEFYRIRAEAAERAPVGAAELREAYDRVHADYDEFWLAEAGKPIEELVARLAVPPDARIFEAGCGTGYGTALLAAKAGPGASYLAVDLSAGMLSEARRRLSAAGIPGVTFDQGDALERLGAGGPFDIVFTSWVLGYIPLAPFFAAASRALAPGGRLAFVAHRDRSPREPLELFGEIVAEDPSVLLKSVAFDFPLDLDHARRELSTAGLQVVEAWDGAAVFHYPDARGVLEHLLKSGAGTAYHEALDPARRPALEAEFLRRLAARHPSGPIAVVHDCVSVIARR